MSLGFPSTKSGIELKIQRKLFSEKGARMFLSLTAELKTLENIATDDCVRSRMIKDALEEGCAAGKPI